MIVKKAQRLDVECIVRGYLAGSAWAEYKDTGRLFGIRMPAGMQESEALPEPLFTPTTKAEVGHDENISFSDLIQEIGPENALRPSACAVWLCTSMLSSTPASAASSSPTRSSSSASSTAKRLSSTRC